MKYNIFTVLNEGYEKFGILFVSSIIDKLDLDLIDNIFVYDTGLTTETKNKLKIFEKVKIVDSGLDSGNDTSVHSVTWQKNVYSKAKLLKHCVENQEIFYPTVMVDVDCIFIREFFDLVDVTKDAILCKRSMRGRVQGHQATSSHIGSFFSINKRTPETMKFLDLWISNIDKVSEKGENGSYTPKESPALSLAYDELNSDMNLGELPEPIIANIEITPPHDARIYHLKSDFRFLTIESRVNQPRAIQYSERYFL